MFIRSSRVNLQIMWSSILFQQVPYTHMKLNLGNLGVFLFQKSNVLEKKNNLDMVVFYGTNSLVILGAYRYPNFKVVVKISFKQD